MHVTFQAFGGFFMQIVERVKTVVSNCGYKETMKCALTSFNLKLDGSTAVMNFPASGTCEQDRRF